jgi:hypothetical protein
MEPKFLFDLLTPLGFKVHCTQEYWDFLVAEKHPALKGHEIEVQQALSDPQEIRRSTKDSAVYLFYRGDAPRWICAVAKSEGLDGFLVTAYPADKLKIGEVIWTKSK